MSDETISEAAEPPVSSASLMPDPLLMVTAPQLFTAVEFMPEAARLVNGVEVTRAQLKKAAEILRDGPQPVANGLRADMPGFIDRAAQRGRSLVLQVGILPSRTYRITRTGRATQAAPQPPEKNTQGGPPLTETVA